MARPWKEEPDFHREAAPDTKGYAKIPDALFEAITFLAQALPKRSAPAWLELLFGAMCTQGGLFWHPGSGKRQILHRWRQILAVGYASPQLLALRKEGQVNMLAPTAPWRAKQHATRRSTEAAAGSGLAATDLSWPLAATKLQAPEPTEISWFCEKINLVSHHRQSRW